MSWLFVIFGFVKETVKVINLAIMCRFSVADDKPRRPTMVGGRIKFACSGSRQRME